MSELRQALRRLGRSPGFALLAVAMLGLGVGTNTAVFSLVNTLLLRGLPVPAPGDLLSLFQSNPKRGVERDVTSVPNFRDWRDQSTCFTHVSAVDPGQATLATPEGPEVLAITGVSASFFDLLGVPPVAGRGFRKGEDEEGAPLTAILSHRFWQSRFGGRPMLGSPITLDGRPFTVIGIAKEGLEVPVATDVYVPAIYPADSQRGALFLPVIARLAKGKTLADARTQLAAIMERIPSEKERGWTASAVPLAEDAVSDQRMSLLLLQGAVLLVLLIVAANLAALLLARAARKTRDGAVRAALGASRMDLAAPLLAEGVVLALGGWLFGLLLGRAFLAVLLVASPAALPAWARPVLDGRVLLVSLGAALGTALLASLVAIGQKVRSVPIEALREGSRATPSRGSRRAQAVFVVLELTLSVALLGLAGLTLRTLSNLATQNLGFESRTLLVANLLLPGAEFETPGARRSAVQALTERLSGLPGVTSVSGTTTLPLGGNYNDTVFGLEDRPDAPATEPNVTGVDQVLPGYFETMGMALREGRDLSPRSAPDPRASEVVVNQAFERRYFPGASALGKRVFFGPRADPRRAATIVGVVSDVKRESLRRSERPQLYFSYLDITPRRMTFVLRTALTPGELSSQVRAAIREVAPAAAITSVTPMDSVLGDNLTLPRFLAGLLTFFAVTALVLAALGLFGVLSTVVAQRTNEIGVRLALGAKPGDVFRLVTGQGLGLAAAGLALGVGLSLGLGRLLGGLLYGVSATDPTNLASVAAVLFTVASLACILPARRAASLDPVAALREE
ncbi:MAG: ABC transporter permease [Acidobacteria bacterium]|nr:ABC transporter permease [Acidobacteriota bacterium]